MEEKKIESNEIPRYERSEYIDIRKQYLESIIRSSNLIDRTLITLTSAAIG